MTTNRNGHPVELGEALVKMYHEKPRRIAYTALFLLGAGASYLWWSGDEFGKAIGPNLLADAVMLTLGYFIFDKLLESEANRKIFSNERIVYRVAQSIYRKVFYLWAGLVSLHYDPADLAKTNIEPFSDAAKDAIKNIEKSLNNSGDKARLIKSISQKAIEIEEYIEDFHPYIDSILDPDLRLMLFQLKKSDFLNHSADLERAFTADPLALSTFAANLLWDSSDHQRFMVDLFKVRWVTPDYDLGVEDDGIAFIIPRLHVYLSALAERVARVENITPLPYQLTGDVLTLARASL